MVTRSAHPKDQVLIRMLPEIHVIDFLWSSFGSKESHDTFLSSDFWFKKLLKMYKNKNGGEEILEILILA